MPELPEVETVCRELRQALSRHPRVTKVHLRRRTLRVPVPDQFEKILEGQAIVRIRRRAKYLLFDTATSTIISHLGMSGSWRIETGKGQHPLKHDHCDIIFESGQRLIFHDPRRFGLIDCVELGRETDSRWLKALGPEPLSEDLSAEYLFAKAKGKASALKTFIMDQKIVVGVGNIYASEALFKAKVRPQRKVGRVKLEEWKQIVKAIRAILNRAIESGGSTIRDYRNSSGGEGSFQKRFKVYDRAGEPCSTCGEKVRTQVQVGRSTYWCAQCQK